MSTDDDGNPYELLGVPTSATDQEIRTAYRKTSIKVHPDRNPDDPEAPAKFHALNQAYELLLDPLRRMALDAKQRMVQAKKERYATYDKKRKEMVEELEERERAFKKMRMEKGQEERKRKNDEERIKEEGKRMREQAEAARIKQQEHQRQQAEEEDIPALGPLDTTVRLRYTLASHPTLDKPESLSSLLSQFGEIDTSLIIFKPKKKTVSALVPFKQIGHAFAAVTSSSQKQRGLDGIEIKWAGGKDGEEPGLLKWLRKMGKLDSVSLTPKVPSEKPSGSFSSFPDKPIVPPAPATNAPGMDYENLTLMRLRQAERERLEREILEAEERGEEG
ncbi:DnaJ-domain-containing protein [Flagelloscypha sp. PMI_526]|nr:DnaJ-domain-containing protein [Flagelloscypha sp. PMI_526]